CSELPATPSAGSRARRPSPWVEALCLDQRLTWSAVAGRRLAIVLAGLVCVVLAAPDSALSISRSHLRHGLAKQMRHVGGASGAFVSDIDASRTRTLFVWSSHTRWILASNTKLFTMAALLDRYGASATFETRAYAR